MSILPKAIYRLNAIPTKLPTVFHRTRTNNFTICMETRKKTQIAKAILRNKNGNRGINLPDFRLYTTKLVIKTVWCWHKEGNIDQ